MSLQEKFQQDGFAVVNNIFSKAEVETILDLITHKDKANTNFRKTTDLFAIRQFLKEVPECIEQLFNHKLLNLIKDIAGEDYFLTKSIYFDKPGGSNWFVAWHQDLMISVSQKAAVDGYSHWSVKHNHVMVQPPVYIQKKTITIRIHLHDTDEHNGALYVVPGTHTRGIYRPETIDWTKETETCCEVPSGSVMLMKPLLLHSSRKTTNSKNRSVIHLEFNNLELPLPLQWFEKMQFFTKHYV